MFVSISFISTLPDKQEGYVIDTVWFTVVYIFVAYLKKYNKENRKVPYTYLGMAAIVAYIALTSFVFLNKVIKDNLILQVINKFAVQYLDDIKTIPNFLIALFITLWILNSKEHHNSIINNISKPVFSIYIIHQIPVLIPFLWIKVFKSDRWITNHYFWYVIVSYIIFYLLCSFIDMIRRKFLEPLIVKTKAYEKALVLIKR